MPMNPKAGYPGPGPFTVRDDQLNMNSLSYGDKKDIQAIKSGAKLASTPDVRPASAAGVRSAAASAPVTPLFAPTQRPDEPITTGVPIGPGAGPEVLGINNNLDTQEDKDRMISYLPALEVVAASPNSSQAFRNYVRMLRANLL